MGLGIPTAEMILSASSLNDISTASSQESLSASGTLPGLMLTAPLLPTGFLYVPQLRAIALEIRTQVLA